MTTTDEARVTDERFDVCAYGRREGLFHCSEPHDVLGVSHDHRCDDLRAAFRTLADRLAARDAERAEMVALLERIHEAEVNSWSSTLAELAEDDCRIMLAKLRGSNGSP